MPRKAAQSTDDPAQPDPVVTIPVTANPVVTIPVIADPDVPQQEVDPEEVSTPGTPFPVMSFVCSKREQTNNT